MARIVFLLSLFISVTVSASERLIILSDLDDTIKITKVQRPVRSVMNGVFTKKVFAGIPELFKNFDDYVEKKYVLTNSPSILNHKINELFYKHHLNIDVLFTRNLFRNRDSYKYKLSKVRHVLKNNPNSKIILLGDNTDADDEIYQQIQKEYPSRVAAIYMHKVRNEKIRPGQKAWISVLDIAYYEYQAGRLSYAQVQDLFNKLAKSPIQSIVPSKLYCPRDKNLWAEMVDSHLNEMINTLATRLVNYCKRELAVL